MQCVKRSFCPVGHETFNSFLGLANLFLIPTQWLALFRRGKFQEFRYTHQPRTVLNSIRDVFMRTLQNICTENSKKNLQWGSFLIKLHDCILQPATSLKLPLQNTFLKLLRKERMFSSFEKIIENVLYYRCKSRIFHFNKNGIHAKYFLLVF